jgi:hypothetical protein
MFAFAPSAAYVSQTLLPPQVYQRQPTITPRDRYLAALAEAQSAEAEYVASLARDKAIQMQKQEEKVVLLREEAIRRQLLLENSLYSQNSVSYDSYSGYPSAYQRYFNDNSFDSEADAEVTLLEELERRHAATARRHRQEELAKRERLIVLRQQQEERKQAQVIAAARHTREMKLREQQARLSRRSEEVVPSLFLGGHATVHNDSRQEKLVSFDRLSQFLPWSKCSFRVQPQFNIANRPRGCGSHRAQRCQAINNEQDEFLKLLFGGQSDAGSHCQCAHKNEKAVCHCATSPGFSASQHRYIFKARQPAVSPSLTQKPREPAGPSTSGLPFKDRLQSHLSNESEPEVRDTLQGVLSSIFDSDAKLERKERVEKKNKDADAVAGTGPSSGLYLKDQLEARLYQDPNVEIHDTIQAILASLLIPQASSSSKDAETKFDAPVPVPASSSNSATEGKGKGKSVSFSVPTVSIPTSKDVVDSMNAIRNIQAVFSTLSSDFSFPTRLDFTPPPSAFSSPHGSDSDSGSTQLAYTSTNAPVRYYEQALSALLSQLDAVESWGNEEVRKGRKELVARIEAALGDVEKEVQERFVQCQARNEQVDTKVKAKENIHLTEALIAEDIKVIVTPPVEEAVTVVTEGPAAAMEDVSAAAANEETVPTVDSETTLSFVPSDDESYDDSGETISPGHIPVPASSVSSINETLASATEGSAESEESLSEDLRATISLAERDTTSIVENTTGSEPNSSYPPASQADSTSAAASAEVCAAREEPELVDTFLLPSNTELPVITKQPAVQEEDELVVIDKASGEGSDGENWSEVEA